MSEHRASEPAQPAAQAAASGECANHQGRVRSIPEGACGAYLQVQSGRCNTTYIAANSPETL
ncbi:MAG: hypothetical protein A3K83_07575 [Omnitrophica WOR_2 bacterium RBG_13_44_8b]|nr:MAG: hypothetical protein A3K83_07575 [Omnitrophica WOR_2 bacterium RBG_13_44_8b]